MKFELVYTIEKIPAKKGHQAFSLTPSNNAVNPSIYIFDFINKMQFSLYKNNIKLIEYKSNIELSHYSFKLNNINDINNFIFCPKAVSSGYKVTRKRFLESSEVNWSWNYSNTTLNYTLINKNAQNIEIARISGFSLDGQNTGMLCISDSISEDYQAVIIFTACIIWNRSLLSPWIKFSDLFNRKK
ncbi:hypothetical protein CONCODRAFT_11003 [Conidiobolus coronatus NRRL 28638]|uniref:Uncharacterized protein n=1 Tax=Conidiobolus coronatus (strain ATCC 28846 / CBS 209.66 / NRRL 28638) TaxID=796925 RepID=A0A137NWJ0_CONC2|nr:hypothetical protein CONCODRAFT_11003 [Conidiobolus coronatus NRRL 28638]|eukprot:KXN67021.1 hypothetical protein CONCODRAFT_11003 [Conidiobolus coronatus NRRL 28638]